MWRSKVQHVILETKVVNGDFMLKQRGTVYSTISMVSKLSMLKIVRRRCEWETMKRLRGDMF